jgi:hypothetical protein
MDSQRLHVRHVYWKFLSLARIILKPIQSSIHCFLTDDFRTALALYNYAAMKSSVFWDSTPCCPVSRPAFRGNMSSSSYHSTLKTEAIYCSETPVDPHWTTWRYIPGDRIIHEYLLFPKNARVVKKTKGSKSLGPLRNGKARDVLQISDPLKTECRPNYLACPRAYFWIAHAYGYCKRLGFLFD